MPQRQLNIRSDEAVDRAASLAKRLGRTTTDVVVEALRSYEAQVEPLDERGMTADQRRRYEALKAAAQEFSAQIPPGTDLSGDWIYDDRGLPR